MSPFLVTKLTNVTYVVSNCYHPILWLPPAYRFCGAYQSGTWLFSWSTFFMLITRIWGSAAKLSNVTFVDSNCFPVLPELWNLLPSISEVLPCCTCGSYKLLPGCFLSYRLCVTKNLRTADDVTTYIVWKFSKCYHNCGTCNQALPGLVTRYCHGDGGSDGAHGNRYRELCHYLGDPLDAHVTDSGDALVICITIKS